MLQLHSCPHGHFWEDADDKGESRCPQCGEPPDALPMLDLAPSVVPKPVAVPIEMPLVDETGQPVVAGYEIIEDLGRGPTGIRLYRAKQVLVNREVLLEVVLAREDATHRAWSSLRSEAAALGKLSHPNIVAIHEAGERDRRLFYNAISFVAGPTLSQKVADKPLPITQVIRLMELLARAVDHASERGVLHRHLEPAKVLLSSEPGPVARSLRDRSYGDPAGVECPLHSGWYIPQITGFGLARRPVEGDPIDANLYVEPGFLSPEQAWGRTKEYGPHTDVYGLGGILYFLITGRPPFRGPTLGGILDAVQTAELKPPSTFRGVPGDLEAICKKCLARQIRHRYRRAGELADDLRRLADGYPVSARPATGFTHIGRWMRRRPAATALLFVILFGVCVPLIGYGMGNGSPSARQELLWQEMEASRLRTQVEEMRHQQRFLDYTRRLAFAAEALARKDVVQAERELESCDRAERGIEWHCLFAQANGLPLTQKEFGGEASVVAMSTPTVVAVVRDQDDKETIWSYRPFFPPGRAETTPVGETLGRPVRGIGFSPDGRRLAIVTGLEKAALVLYRRDEEGVEERPLTQRQLAGGYPCGVSFSPDGSELAVPTARGLIHLFDAGNGQRRRTLGQWGAGFKLDGKKIDLAREPLMRVAYTPDGRQLIAFTPGDTELRVFDRNTERPGLPGFMDPGRPIPIQGGEVQAMNITPRGHLALAVSDGSVRFVDVHSWAEQERLTGFSQSIRQLAFSPNGQRLAAADAGGRVHLFGKGPLGWVRLATIAADGTVGLLFSEESQWLVAASWRKVTILGQPE